MILFSQLFCFYRPFLPLPCSLYFFPSFSLPSRHFSSRCSFVHLDFLRPLILFASLSLSLSLSFSLSLLSPRRSPLLISVAAFQPSLSLSLPLSLSFSLFFFPFRFLRLFPFSLFSPFSFLPSFLFPLSFLSLRRPIRFIRTRCLVERKHASRASPSELISYRREHNFPTRNDASEIRGFKYQI